MPVNHIFTNYLQEILLLFVHSHQYSLEQSHFEWLILFKELMAI